MVEHRTVTMASWNVQRGQYGWDKVADTLDQLVTEKNASIIFLQEATSRQGIQVAINAVKDALPSQSTIVSFTTPQDETHDGLIIAVTPESGMQLVNEAGLLLSKPRRLLQKPEKHVGALIAKFKTQEGEVIQMTNVHLADAFRSYHRVRQAEEIAGHLTEYPQYALFGGDTNSIGLRSQRVARQMQKIYTIFSPDRPVVNLTEEVKSTHNLLGSFDDDMSPIIKIPGSFFHDRLKVRIWQNLDRLAGVGVTALKSAVIHVAHSDHLPVLATFALGEVLQVDNR